MPGVQTGTPGAPPPAFCELRITDATLAPAGTLLRLPAETLTDVALPARLCHPHAQWPDVACILEIEQLPADMLSLLQPGGLVLLPRSLQGAWTVSVHAEAGSPCPLPHPRTATLDVTARRLTLLPPDAPLPAAPPGQPQQVQVRLDDTVAWPLDLLQGRIPADAVPPRLLARRRASLWLDGHCCARGQLVPAGQGHGLWISTVSLPAQAIDIVLDAA